MISTPSSRLAAPLAALALGTLSCSVVPMEAAPPRVAAQSVAQPAPAPDPVLTHVRQELSRHQTGLTPRETDQLAETIVAEARRHDLDPGLVLAVMHVESRFYNFAVSPVKALGLMQILPSTGEWLAAQLDIPWEGPQSLFDPVVNVRLGVAYLRQLTDRYDGSLSAALSAYNWGPGHIDGRIRRGTPLPKIYARSVLDAYGETATRS